MMMTMVAPLMSLCCKMDNMSVVFNGAKRKKNKTNLDGFQQNRGGRVGDVPRNDQLNLGGDPGIFILRGLLGFC